MKDKIEIVEELAKLVGNIYGVRIEIPEHLKHSINGEIYDMLIKDKEIMVIYDEHTRMPKYVKRLA